MHGTAKGLARTSRATTSEQVYGELRGLILENTLAPGERVNIDALARQLGVSQTPVREAVRRLEGDALLSRIPGQGYRTAQLIDLERLRDIFEYRLLIEQWAAREVAGNRLTNPARALRVEVERFNNAVLAQQDIRPLLLAHDMTFHGTILNSLQNSVIRSAYEQTHCHFHAFLLYAADTDGHVTVDEHLRIIQAFEKRDAEAAEIAMREHLIGAYHRFARYFSTEAELDLRRPDRFPVH